MLGITFWLLAIDLKYFRQEEEGDRKGEEQGRQKRRSSGGRRGRGERLRGQEAEKEKEEWVTSITEKSCMAALKPEDIP